MNRQIRRFCVIGMLALALLSIACLLIMNRVDEEIRRLVEQKVAAHYPDMRVSVGSARRIEGSGIEIRGLVIAMPDSGEETPSLRIDELFVRCDTELSRMIAGGVQAEELRVKRMRLRAVRGTDGRWDVQRLWPPPKFSQCNPRIRVSGAELDLIDRSSGSERLLSLRQIDLDLVPRVLSPTTVDEIRSSDCTLPPIEVSGRMESPHFGLVELNGTIDMAADRFEFEGKTAALIITPRLFDALPAESDVRLGELRPLQGRADFEFSVSRGLDGTDAVRFSVAGDLSDGQIEHPRLPHALHDVHGRFSITERRIEVEQLTARHDNTDYRVSFQRDGSGPSAPWRLRGHVDHLELSPRFSRTLPPQLLEAWQRFQPRGILNVDVDVVFDGQKYIPAVEAECLDVSALYDKFPYPLTGVQGKLVYRDDTIESEKLTAEEGGIEMAFRFRNPGPEHTGFFRFRMHRPLPLDRRLMTALKNLHAKGHEIVESLHPTGNVVASGYFVRGQPRGPTDKNLTVDVKNGSVNYEKFPYPLHQVQGTMELSGGRWEFTKFVAYNDSAFITCSGHWAPAGSPDEGLVLEFRGTDVPLEDELREALRPGARRVWMDLRPRGTLDYLAVTLKYRPENRRLSVLVKGEKYRPQQNVEGRTIAVHPAWFPYQFDDVTGKFHYEDGKVVLQDVRAAHDEATLDFDGECEFQQPGSWSVRLRNVNATQFRPSHELLDAMPRKLGEGLRKLHLTGPLSAHGELSVERRMDDTCPLSRWDMEVDVEGGQLDCGPRLEDIRGSIRLTGTHDARGLNCRGEVGIDSMLCRGTQLTWLRGPLLITDKAIVLGAGAAVEKDRQPRRLTAHVWGGTCALDAHVALLEHLPFQLRVDLNRADLAQIARDLGSANQNLSGSTTGVLNLTGNSGGTYSWKGDGYVRLEDADLYEVPLIVALLTPLRNRPLDRVVFDSSNIQYKLEGEHIYFQQIDFLSEALTLKGKGEMDLQRHVDLQFYTLVGRDYIHIPLLRPVLGEASRQILMIEIAGTLDYPKITRKAFPRLNDALQQLFPELTRVDTAASRSNGAGGQQKSGWGWFR